MTMAITVTKCGRLRKKQMLMEGFFCCFFNSFLDGLRKIAQCTSQLLEVENILSTGHIEIQKGHSVDLPANATCNPPP